MSGSGLSDNIGGDHNLNDSGDCNRTECIWLCDEAFEPFHDMFECDEVGKEGIAEGTDIGL